MSAAFTKRRPARESAPAQITMPDPGAIDARLAGWRWRTTFLADGTPEYQLIASDGWETKQYQKDTKAVAEALRRVRSLPAEPNALPAPLEAVAAALRQWRRPTDYEAAYEAARASGAQHYARAMAAVDARVEGRPLEEVLALLAPAPAETQTPPVPVDLPGWRWEADADRLRLTQPAEGWVTCWELSINAGDALDEARAIQARDAAAVAELAPATAVAAFTPGPDAGGVYRRPPGMAERLLVAPRDLVDGRWQPREAYDEAALVELTASISEHGVLEDLIALVNQYGEIELITGHRRKRAAQAAGGRDVPVRVVEVTEAQAEEIAIISNDQRADLTDVERGKAYEKIIAAQGISEVQLAKRLGRDRTYVQQRRLIARAAPELHAALTTGALNFSQARAICQGSGGDHGTQQAVTAHALAELKAGRPERAEDLAVRAERTIRERYEGALTALGWSVVRYYLKSRPQTFVFAAAAMPAVWSSAEILAAVGEGRRPPDVAPAPDTLLAEDAETLGRRGWKSVREFLPHWAAAEKADQLFFGDQARAVVAEARADLGRLGARFEAAGWAISWRGSSLVATVGKGKAKREARAYSYSEATKLIGQIEKGTLPEPDAAYKHACKRCAKKTSDATFAEGAYYCAACLPTMRAELSARRERIVAAVEAQAGAWLDTAPALVVDLLLHLGRRGDVAQLLGMPERWLDAAEADQLIAQASPEARAAALRRVVAAWLDDRRADVGARHGITGEVPATAVAAPALPEPAAPLTFEQITANLDRLEARPLGAGDQDVLLDLVGALDDLVAELSDAQYDGTIARLGELLSVFDGGPA